MLEVSLFKSVLHKLKILGGGNLNSVKQWGEPQKQILKFQWGEAKEGRHDFSVKFSGGGNLGRNYVMETVN